jgi:hypothetical protein
MFMIQRLWRGWSVAEIFVYGSAAERVFAFRVCSEDLCGEDPALIL